jgi:alkylation response protein AidB-like acyl-CoA dehydrogenase
VAVGSGPSGTLDHPDAAEALVELTLTDDQDFFRQTTTRFLSNECPLTQVRALATSPAGYTTDYWRQGAELGWTSLLVPESEGGGSISGAGVVDLTIVADAFGRSVAPGPLVPSNVVAFALATSGNDQQRSEVLPGLLSGETVAAWCGADLALGNQDRLTGPVAQAQSWRTTVTGSTVDPSSTTTRSTVDGGFVLTGGSPVVESAAQADHLLVTAHSGEGLVQLLVPAAAAGVTLTPLRSLDVVRRFARVDFNRVRVPSTAQVGTTASTPTTVERQLQLALVMQTAEMVGAAERTFDFTVEWAFDRYSFGRPLASYQELKHRFADMKMWLEASHALAAALAREVQGEASSAAETASVAKAYLGEYLVELMQDCVQIHGGIGLTSDHDLHLYLRRVTIDRLLHGSPADHRQRIASVQAA